VVDISSIIQRYDRYDWDEKFGSLRILSSVVLIFGIILVLVALVLCGGILLGKIPLSYSASTKATIALVSLIIGLVLGLGSIVGSLLIRIFVAMERNMRYAMNVWLILEERDFGEEAEGVEPVEESEDNPVEAT